MGDVKDAYKTVAAKLLGKRLLRDQGVDDREVLKCISKK
jgi:hypothetical protein